MRVVAVAAKALRETVREPKLLAMVLLTPVAFLVVFRLAFGGYFLVTHPVLVMTSGGAPTPLVEALRAERYPDGRPTFAVEPIDDLALADERLTKQTASALVVERPSDAGAPLAVTVRGDAASMAFVGASNQLEAALRRHSNARVGERELLEVRERRPGVAGPVKVMDVAAPGLLVFAILLIVPQSAMLIGREVRCGTLRRLRLTRLRSWELFAGLTLAQMVVAVGQVAVLVAVVLALGIAINGSVAGALVVCLALALSSVGVGLVTACFIGNDSQALNFGSGLTMVQVFLSGAFFPMPPLTVTSLFGHELGAFDFIPASHGLIALHRVLVYGDGLGDVAFRLGATVALSLAYFALGVALFARLRMGEER